MPDSFFQSEKKRKRPDRFANGSAGPSKPYEKPYRPAVYGKGQKQKGQAALTGQRKTKSGKDRDEDLSSDADGEGGVELDDMEFRAGRGDDERLDEDLIDENETGAEKRVRLAKSYLNKVRDEMEAARDTEDYDAAEIDRELIASRLQKDVAEAEGSIHSFISPRISIVRTRLLSMPSHAPTSIAVTTMSIFVSTKRGSITEFPLPSLRKSAQPFGQSRPALGKQSATDGHRGEILCLAASEDGRYVVSGGRDKVIGVWEREGDSMKWRAGMRGHKDAVTSIAFPPLNNPSHHILTASLSRHLTLHSLSTLSTIDTFFGHQDSIPSVSSLRPTLAVTAGSRDRTCRWWKVEEEVQLVLRGGGRTFEPIGAKATDGQENAHLGASVDVEVDVDGEKRAERTERARGREFVEGSVDCVCMLDEQRFLSGGDSGSLCLWQTVKKKPIFTKPLAHGIDNLLHEPGQDIAGPRWITAIAHLRGTDLFASGRASAYLVGSWDGEIKLWALNPTLRSFSLIRSLPVNGFINDIQLISIPSSAVDSTKWSTSSTDQVDGTQAGQGARQTRSGLKEKREILLVAAVAQEPRLGRWMRLRDGVKNGVFVAHVELDGDAGL